MSSSFRLIIGLLSGIVLTRSLGPELKGELSILSLITNLYAPILLFGYSGGVLFYGLRKAIDVRDFFWTGFVLTACLSLLSIPLLNLFAINGFFGGVIQSVDTHDKWIAFAAIPLIFLNNYVERVIRINHLFRAINRRLNLTVILSAIIYLILWLQGGLNLKSVLLVIFCAHLVALFINVLFAIRTLKVNFSWQGKLIFYPFTYGWKNWINQIIANSNEKFDQIILTYFLSPLNFGLYVAGVGISNLLTKIPVSYINVFYNQISQRSIESALNLYARTQRITFLFTTLISIILMLIAHPLISLTYGKDYLDSVEVVLWYAPGLIFQVASRISVKFYAGIGMPLKNSLIFLGGFVGSLPFYFWLIPKYGLCGAAMASSVSYFIAFLVSFIQINRDYDISLSSVCMVRAKDLSYLMIKLKNLMKSKIVENTDL